MLIISNLSYAKMMYVDVTLTLYSGTFKLINKGSNDPTGVYTLVSKYFKACNEYTI